MDLFEKAFKENEPIHALKSFLMVEAPDVVYKNAMYYNEKGEGLLDTFWTINPEPTKHIEGEKVYWINAQGERFNVAKTEDYVIRNKKRLAETDEDFSEIYNREFKSRNLENNYTNNKVFLNEIIEQTTALISSHQEKLPPGKRDVKIIGLANQFISFLKNPFHNYPDNENNNSFSSVLENGINKLMERIPSEINKKEKSISFQFIDDVRSKYLGELDIHYKLNELTANYDKDLLIALLSDVNLYLDLHKEELTSFYYHSDIQAEILSWGKKGKKIPLLKSDGIERCVINKEDLDIEKLMFPDEFTAVYRLLDIIKDKIDDNKPRVNDDKNKTKIDQSKEIITDESSEIDEDFKTKEIKSLKWNSVDHSDLNHIHKSLKENGYINCGLSYFKKSFLGTKDFEKIEWLRVDSSLIYFYGRLIDKNKIKKPSNKWLKFKDVFQYSGSSAASLYSQYKNESKNLPDKSFFDSLIK